MSGLSIVVFTYNSEPLIDPTLDALDVALECMDLDHELMVVDNNSSDATLNRVRTFAGRTGRAVEIVENPVQGHMHSRIAALERVRHEYVCFIDDDNRVRPDYFQVLQGIIREHAPDAIGGIAHGVADVPLPEWWDRYEGVYACGTRHEADGFLDDPLTKLWGAGLAARTEYARKALTLSPPLCTGRSGGEQTGGDDAEMNYRMRLLGARFYHSRALVLDHHMKAPRLSRDWLRKTFRGNARALIHLEIYKKLLTGRRWYDLRVQALVFLLAAPLLSLHFGIDYFTPAWRRIRTLPERLTEQRRIAATYRPEAMRSM